MVIAFLIIAGLVALAILVLILRPVWRSKAVVAPGPTSPLSGAPAKMSGDEAARLAVYRDRRSEIEREREAGRLSAEEAARQQQDLVDEVAREFGQSETTGASPANPWAASTLTLLGLALALGVYLVVGAPSLVNSAALKQQLEDSRNPEKVIASAETRVKANPGDVQSWLVLGAAYKFTGDLPKSLAAYETAFKLAPPQTKDSAGALAEYAEVVAMSRGNDFNGKPMALLTQALKLDADEPKALAMMGAAQFRAGNVKEARVYLGRLVDGMAPDSPEAEHLRPLLAKLDERIKNGGTGPLTGPMTGPANGSADATSPHGKAGMMTGAGAATQGDGSSAPAGGPPTVFSGKAVLSAKAREAGAWKDVKTVFISIRSGTPGAPPMPLAAIKVDQGNQEGDWPLKFSIGDAQAMNQQVSLAQAGPVAIEVHLSRSGQPGKKPGDWYGRLNGLDGGKGQHDKLDVQIDQQQP